MAPFRWPSMQCDTMLCKEVLAEIPSSHNDWDIIAEVLSQVFSTEGKAVQLKGRGSLAKPALCVWSCNTARAPEARGECYLGGSGGILPRQILKFRLSETSFAAI